MRPVDVFFAVDDAARRPEVVRALAQLRAEGYAADTDYAGRSLKGQLTQAQRLGAETVVVAHEAGFTVRRSGREDAELDRLEDLEL
jgi:histidyl-tRNA synthetase